jgi:hypothetical protein
MSNNPTRREAIRKAAVGGAAVAGGVPVLARDGAADTFTFTVNQYPAEYDDAESGSYKPNNSDTIEYSHTWGVRIEHVHENNGEHLFGVNLSTNALTRWGCDHDTDNHEPCGAIWEQELEVSWPDSAAAEDEVVFRDNDEWISGHTYDGGDDKTWYEAHAENFVSYLIDLGQEAIETSASVAMSTGKFLLNTFETVTDNENKKKYRWNYDGTHDSIAYPGATEGAAWVHFHVYVDEGESTSFKTGTTHYFVNGFNRGVEYEFVLEPPA